MQRQRDTSSLDHIPTQTRAAVDEAHSCSSLVSSGVDSPFRLITFTYTEKKVEGSSVTHKFTIAFPSLRVFISLSSCSFLHHLFHTAFVLDNPSSSLILLLHHHPPGPSHESHPREPYPAAPGPRTSEFCRSLTWGHVFFLFPPAKGRGRSGRCASVTSGRASVKRRFWLRNM